MAKLTYKAKAWNDTFPEVTKKQYLVMAFLLSWQDSGGVNATEVGLRVFPDAKQSKDAARGVLKALEAKGYVEEREPEYFIPHRKSVKRMPRDIFGKPSRKWKLTLHGCLYLKNYPMPE